jgi:C-8 sterol isomerase
MASYTFDPEELRDVALRHVGKPVSEIVSGLERDLKAEYGDLIHLDMPWVVNPAGFAMYQVKMIFARANEYIGIMGVPIASTGHTGRHPVTYYDTILSGGSRKVAAGEFEPRTISAGDFLVTRPWEAFTFSVPDHILFLEYCRGPLPILMPFGLANYLFGTLDFKSAFQIVRSHATLAWRSRGVSTPHAPLP